MPAAAAGPPRSRSPRAQARNLRRRRRGAAPDQAPAAAPAPPRTARRPAPPRRARPRGGRRPTALPPARLTAPPPRAVAAPLPGPAHRPPMCVVPKQSQTELCSYLREQERHDMAVLYPITAFLPHDTAVAPSQLQQVTETATCAERDDALMVGVNVERLPGGGQGPHAGASAQGPAGRPRWRPGLNWSGPQSAHNRCSPPRLLPRLLPHSRLHCRTHFCLQPHCTSSLCRGFTTSDVLPHCCGGLVAVSARCAHFRPQTRRSKTHREVSI